MIRSSTSVISGVKGVVRGFSEGFDFSSLSLRQQIIAQKYSTKTVTPDKYKISETRKIPKNIPRPAWIDNKNPVYARSDPNPYIYSSEQVKRIHESAQIVAGALKEVEKVFSEGMSGDEVDIIVHDYICSKGAYPSGVGFMGFPKSVCISQNDIMCHGIPNSYIFKKGDFANFDATCFKNGVFGDSSINLYLDDGDQAINMLVSLSELIFKQDACQEAVYKSIKKCIPGNTFSDISDTIQYLFTSIISQRNRKKE